MSSFNRRNGFRYLTTADVRGIYEWVRDYVSGSSGSMLTTYDAGNGCWVSASAAGVTFSKAGGTGTIVIPSGVRLSYFRVNGATADLDGSGNFKVVFNYTGGTGNTNLASFLPPTAQVINTAASLGGGPSDGLPFVYNQGVVPTAQVTAVGSGDITVRVVALDSYSNWAIFGATAK